MTTTRGRCRAAWVTRPRRWPRATSVSVRRSKISPTGIRRRARRRGDCGSCVEEAHEGLAAWLDSEPTFESARIVFLCEIYPLVMDLMTCVHTTAWLGDDMYECVDAAICRNCSGC